MKINLLLLFLILIINVGCHNQKDYYSSLRHYKKQLRKNKTDIGFVLFRFSTENEFELLISEIEKLGGTLSTNVEKGLNSIYFKNKKFATKENLEKLTQLLKSKKSINHIGGIMKSKKGKTYLVLTNRIILKLDNSKATKESLDKILKKYKLKKVREMGESKYVYKIVGGEMYDIIEVAIQLHQSGFFEEVLLDGFSAPPNFDI